MQFSGFLGWMEQQFLSFFFLSALDPFVFKGRGVVRLCKRRLSFRDRLGWLCDVNKGASRRLSSYDQVETKSNPVYTGKCI